MHWGNEVSSSRRQKYPPSLQAECRGLPQPLLKLNNFSRAIGRQHKGVGTVSTDSWARGAPKSSGLSQKHRSPPPPRPCPVFLASTRHRMTVLYIKLDSRKDLAGIECFKRKPCSSSSLLLLEMSKKPPLLKAWDG